MNKYMKIIICFLCIFITKVNADTTYVKGMINKDTSGVNVRTCANTDCPTVKNDTGSGISLSYPESFEIIGEENNFYKIKLQYSGYDYTGYISKGTDTKEYVIKTEYVIKDETIKEVEGLGFPASYVNKIALLKTMHPTWSFKPYQVNATFDEVIAGETKYVSTNLVDGSNTSLRSTEDGAYDDGVWKQFAGGGWYAASKQTVKFYVDPRNFINENHIFMFELLSFDETTQTEEMIKALLKGSFMEGDTFYYDEKNVKQTISYANAFIDSGKTNSVSAVHLVSRVLQEQGSKGSALVSGTNKEYPGYYNFFNIKANGETTSDVIHNGLAYAKKKEWNSPYASILGGGSLLNSYIKYGQNTLYLEKFDFAGDTYYTNQYMQNIRAPYSESYTAYKAYLKSDFLETAFVFSIPVFKGDMPSVTSLDSKFNEDSTLSSLKITNCNFTPSFSTTVYKYTCSLDEKIESVTVTGVATSSTSTIKGLGEYTLKETDNVIDIIVTSAAGTTSTYSVTINRVKEVLLSPDEILSKMQISNKNGYISGFDLGSDANSFNKLLNNTYPKATSEIGENKTLFTGMKIKITTDITNEYTVIIYGDNNGDGAIDIIDLLKIQKHILNVNKLKNATFEASDINKDGTIDIVDLLKIQKHILNVKKIEQ